MKAWEDLETNKYISLYSTRLSKWYLDMGVKIERFDDDGRIEIKNTMTPTDSFKDITPDQLKVFEDLGWEAGCLSLNVDVLEERVEWFEHLLEAGVHDTETITRRLEKNREKLLYYQQRLVKFVTP
jgi:hypothetical protein